MINLEKIALKNIVVHKNSSIELQDGITVIRGDNGSGKSLLFNSIPNVFDGCPPLAKKKDAKTIHSDNSAIGIKYKYNDKSYRVVQKNKGNSISYEIEEDNVDLQPRTISMAKEMLEKIFPISTVQYYSLVHLTSYRPSILLSGTGPQRKEFFEELFHLNISEYVLDKIKIKYNELKRSKDEMDILKDQLNSLNYIDNIEELKAKYDKAIIKYNELNAKYLDYFNNIQKLTSIKTYKEQLNTDFTLDELEEKIKDFQNKINILEDKEKQTLVNIDLYNKNENLIAKKNYLLKELDNYKDLSETSDNIKEQYQNKKLELQTLAEELENLKQNNERYKNFCDLEKFVKEEFKIKTYDEYLSYVSKTENSIEEKQKILNKLEKLDGKAICPTCQQVLNEDSIKSLIGSLNNDILYLGIDIHDKDKVLSWLKLKELNLEYKDEKTYEENINKIKDILRELKSLYENLLKKEDLERQIQAIPDILNIEKPNIEDLENIKVKISKGKNKLKLLEADLKIQKELKKLYDLGISNLKQEDLESNINDLSPKLEKLNEIKMNLNSKIQLGESQNQEYLKKKNRIQEIEKSLEDLPVYEALVKAYGAKGIKIDQIRYLANAFCENLNKYANLVYNKKIKFYVNVDSTNFNIIAERNGNPGSDVNSLSGAESRCFMLLCLISLLPFIPEKYRTDFVILDELEAGIQESGRNLLTQGFFNVLKNIVSKIIIITPMSSKEYYIEANQEYYLRLKDNATVMEKIR